MWPKSNLLKDVLTQFKLDLIERFENQEIEVFADYVFEEFCNLSRIDRFVRADYRLSESEIVKITQAIKKLNSNMPIQYVVNKAYFHGLSFFVDQSVLIPRPETEELVSWILEYIDINEKKDILDIGTGSGCIAISLASGRLKSKVTAMDISKESLMVARKNALSNKVNVSFVEEDALHFNKIKDSFFDVIVSNPPYVRNSEKVLMKPNILDFEPDNALFVDDWNPLLFYNSIVNFSLTNLNSNGFVFFEINEAFSEGVLNLLKLNNFSKLELKRDFRGKPRFVKGQLFR